MLPSQILGVFMSRLFSTLSRAIVKPGPVANAIGHMSMEELSPYAFASVGGAVIANLAASQLIGSASFMDLLEGGYFV